jgi:gluconokinase
MIVLVMGVAGVGKTTIGMALAQELGWRFLDADDFHPPENIAKMAAGVPLDDDDRRPWLAKINEELLKIQSARSSAVLACSALKESYRQQLSRGVKDFQVVYLHGPFELIEERMNGRQHRFMPATLLRSQFAALEPPLRTVSIDVSRPPENSVREIVQALQADGRSR